MSRNRNDVFIAYERESDETKRISFLPYYGGKGNLAKRIIRELSPTLIYIEAFGGGASVLLNRPRAEIEVYAEILPDIANVFLTMRDDGENLIWELRYIPYARQAFEDARTANSVPDKITAINQSMNAHGLSGWSRSRSADRLTNHTPNGHINNAVLTAHRQGSAADKITAINQSINSHGMSGWRRTRAIDDRKRGRGATLTPGSHTAFRHGAQDDTVNGASLPFGIIVPISGPEGIDILLSHRPMKCETLADANRDVIALFAAARFYPLPLYRQIRDLSDDVEKAVAIARDVLATGGDIARERLYPWRAISDTWYGQILARLKATQVETKSGEDLEADYAHETNAVITSPVGEERHLGRWLPMNETPLWRVRERLQGVEIRNESAFAVIAEYADNPDAMIYLDPPYVHSSRKSKGDYGAGEMTDADHAALLTLCKRAKANIAISGYRNALYDRELANWRRIDWDVIASSAGGKDNARVESLWTNYDIGDWKPEQGALF